MVGRSKVRTIVKAGKVTGYLWDEHPYAFIAISSIAINRNIPRAAINRHHINQSLTDVLPAVIFVRGDIYIIITFLVGVL